MTTPPRGVPTRIAGAALTLVLTAVFGATACSGGDDSPADPASSGAASDGTHGAPEVATTATIGKVTGGRLTPDRREALKKNVKSIVDGWLDAAYVDGDYPRSGFVDAFPGFTKGAETDARQDLGLMSNAAIGKKIDGVDARKRRLRIDVLAVRKQAVGVTARFVLDFDTTGQRQLSERVKGLLYMTWHQDRGWQVFGYDVSRGARR
jgi:hypothetical protein